MLSMLKDVPPDKARNHQQRDRTSWFTVSEKHHGQESTSFVKLNFLEDIYGLHRWDGKAD